MARVPARFTALFDQAYSFGPLAAAGTRSSTPDPVFFLSGLAVLSAGLVVLRAAQGQHPTVVRAVPARADHRRLYTADEALADRDRRAGDREVLLDALATAAETFYAIAGHLPREASDRAIGKADDLRELVWLNRARQAPPPSAGRARG